MSRSVTLVKGKNNMIGISIGGGAPFCPVLYVVQVFHRSPAHEDGSLCPGDELMLVNGGSLRGLSRKQTADMIQSAKGAITIAFNRVEPPKDKGSDILLKKVKHRLVERMKESTADTLGLSRAVLVNDKLVKKVQYLESNAKVYRGIAEKARGLMLSLKAVVEAHRGVYSMMYSAIFSSKLP
jgi:PDZ domain-containing secreted protein